MPVRFAFNLIDRMSGPANKINGTLDRMSKALAKADSATAMTKGEKALGRLKTTLEKANFGVRVAFGDKAADTLDRFTKGELKVADKAEIARKGLSLVGGAATVATGALVAAGAAAGGFAAAGGKLLLDAQKFKETTGAALAFALGSSKAGQEALGEILRISNVLGASSAESAANFRELTSAGFGDRESKILLQLADDLKAANGGQAVALASIAEPLQALKRNEQLTADSFKGLEAAGMGKDQVYKTLAKQLGVAVQDPNDSNKIKRDVDKALVNQKLRGQKAVDFWSSVNLTALNEKAFGEKALDFRKTTVTGSIDLIKNRWESLLNSIDSKEAGKGLASNLQAVADALDPASESGKQLSATLNSMVSRGTEIAKAFGGGLFDGFKEAKATIDEVSAALGPLGGNTQISSAAFRSLGVALGYVVVGIGAVIGGAAWLLGELASLGAKALGVAKDVGKFIVDGLVDGLRSKFPTLTAALDAILGIVPARAKVNLDIRSPSRVMAKLGAFTTEGFAQGIERGAPRVEESAREMTAGVTRQGVQASGGGGQRPSLVLPPGLIQVTVNTQADVEDLNRRVKEGLIAALREMGFELGVTT